MKHFEDIIKDILKALGQYVIMLIAVVVFYLILISIL